MSMKSKSLIINTKINRLQYVNCSNNKNHIYLELNKLCNIIRSVG